MVWKKVVIKEDLRKFAKEIKNKPMFINAKTRKGKELNQQKNCKLTVEKRIITKR
jgi:hypothetical protein